MTFTNKQQKTTFRQLMTLFGLASLLVVIPSMSYAEEMISKPDIVTANYGDNSISVLLAEHFVDWKTVQTTNETEGKIPFDQAIGDLDGDSILDLVQYSADNMSSSIFVRYGNNLGSFTEATTIELDSEFIDDVSVADMNGDQIADLVVSQILGPINSKISIFFGDENRIFAESLDIIVPNTSRIEDLAVGDFDGDGDNDIAASDNISSQAPTHIQLLVNNGQNGFTIKNTEDFDTRPKVMSVADLNGDGIDDLVSTGQWKSDQAVTNIGVFLGDDNGNLIKTSEITINKPEEPRLNKNHIWTGHVIGNSAQDIVLQHGNEIRMYPGIGDGSFEPVAILTVSPSEQVKFVADINGDGTDEIILDESILFLNDAHKYTAVPLSEVSPPSVIYAGDFDGDEQIDLLLGRGDTLDITSLQVLPINKVYDPFEEIRYDDSQYRPRDVLIDHINTDEKMDILSVSWGDWTTMLPGDGNGGFGEPTTATVGHTPMSANLAHLDNDGKIDLVTANSGANNISILSGDGNGGFADKTNYSVGNFPITVSTGDLDGNAKDDIVTANMMGNSISIILQNDNGTFVRQSPDINVGIMPTDIAIGYLDDDSYRDIVVTNGQDGTITILSGTNSGTFVKETPDITVGLFPMSVAIGDIDGDNTADIITANTYSNTISVLLGDGLGGFVKQIPDIDVGVYPSAVSISDLNGDGYMDIVVSNNGNNNVSILLGKGDATFEPKQDFAVGSQPVSVVIGNLN